MKKAFLILIASLTISLNSWAQTSTEPSRLTGLRRGLATVMLAGLGGAVLGLSTLSFYGDPQDHISNIWTGLALGAIGGSFYVISQNPQTSSFATTSELQISPKGKVSAHRPIFQLAWDF